jgi:hypothetical protein
MAGPVNDGTSKTIMLSEKATRPGAGGLPVMVYDWLDPKIREVAENIWHAQMAGWPRVLTYLYRAKREKRAVRGENMRLVPAIQSRDEYPFASTLENGGNVWIGHAPVAQQNAQGTLIHQFYHRHGAYKKGTTFRFEVRVINHPQGPVTAGKV